MDFYNILEIKKDATIDEIQRAYRKKAFIYHPDRNLDKTEKEKEECEKTFKKLTEAYTILTDENKRKKYDNDNNKGIYDNDDDKDLDNYSNFYSNINNLFTEMFKDFSFDIKSKYGINLKLYRDDNKNNMSNINISNICKEGNIKYNIYVSLEDIYNKVEKEFKIIRKKFFNNIYQQDIKKINIQTYKREIILKNEGNDFIENDTISMGNVYINIYDKDDNNFKRINENDLLYIYKITLDRLYDIKDIKVELLDGNIIEIPIHLSDIIQSKFISIDNYGLPDIENGENRGKLIIYFDIILKDLDYNEIVRVKKIFKTNEVIKDIDYSKRIINKISYNSTDLFKFIDQI
jgi:DnaJ-class molecular chaperone